MIRVALIAALFLATPFGALAQYDEDPAVAAQKAMEDAMAKAQADKARNDAIVAKQREAEAKAKAEAEQKAKQQKSGEQDNSSDPN